MMADPPNTAFGGANAGLATVHYLSFSYVLGAILLLALVLGPILYMFSRYVWISLDEGAVCRG